MRKGQKKRVWTPEQKAEIVHKHFDAIPRGISGFTPQQVLQQCPVTLYKVKQSARRTSGRLLYLLQNAFGYGTLIRKR